MRSTTEIAFAKLLDLQMLIGEVTKWEYEPETIDIVINGIHICKYTYDFRVTYATGRIEKIDTKGRTRTKSKNKKTGKFKYSAPHGYDLFILKKKILKALYDIDIVIVTDQDIAEGKTIYLKDGKNRSHLQHPKRKTANTIQRGTRQKDKTVF